MQISAAITGAGLAGEIMLADSADFLARVQMSQPPFALLTGNYMSEPGIWAEIRRVSPCTQLVLCVLPDTPLNHTFWKQVDQLQIDILCTFGELTACFMARNEGNKKTLLYN